ncbi:MAG: AAA family ATPase [Gammaproteobacteria bacterium]
MLDKLYTLSRHYLEITNKPYCRLTYARNVFKPRLSILPGQRGVGKTTLIVQYLLGQVQNDLLSKEILYIPSDHFSLAGLSLYEIAEQFVQLGGKIIAFDEIHKYSNWSQELKSIYDTFPKLKIIASGSSALEIHKGSHDLTRRAITYYIKGLSLREYLELTTSNSFPVFSLDEILENHEKIAQQILNSLAKLEQKILPLFYQYLQTGYYPYFLDLKETALFYTTLEQNFHVVIESDLATIYPSLTGHSIKKIKQLLSFIAQAVPFTPNWFKIKSIVDVSDDRTLKTYFKYLEDAGLIRMVNGYSKKMRQIEIPEKIYLENTNQLYAISTESSNIGTVRETFFLNTLSSNHEIRVPQKGDFIVNGKIVFEIGGKNKNYDQIKDEKSAYLACDDIEQGIGNKIPLWLFGFLY